MKNPKVDLDSRIVCIYLKTLGMYCFEKINKKGKIAKTYRPPSVCGDSFSEAVDKANQEEGIKIKKTRFKTIVIDQTKYKNWNDYVTATFKKAQDENRIN